MILLVEDDLDYIAITIHTLRKGRIANAIHAVRDGTEALDFAFCRGLYAGRTDGNAELILLDLGLRGMGGLAVLAALKNDERTASIPVVILTASDRSRDMTEAYRLGAAGYIQKPVDRDEFRRVIEQIGMYWLATPEGPLRGA